MAVNPAPRVKILSPLNALTENSACIAYTINGQVEPIISAVGRVYDMASGELIFTYYNNSTPTSTAEGYLFPMVLINQSTSASIVQWASGKTTSDWHNNKQYYIEISTTGRSGQQSAYSAGEPFWAILSPTGSIATIGVLGTIDIAQVTVTASVNLRQTNVANNVERYRFILYEMYTNDIVYDTDWIYDKGIGVGSLYSFDYTFTNLENTKQYKAQFVAYTQLKSMIEADSNIFLVDTNMTISGTLVAENKCRDGCVALTATITGKGSSTTHTPNYVLIERAIAGEGPLKWVGVYERALTSSFDPAYEPVVVEYDDYYAEAGRSFQYRIVPVERQGDVSAKGVGIETTEPVLSEFDKFYIIDSSAHYGFEAGVGYDSLGLNQQVGVHSPLGSTYPTIVRNANTKYRNGGFAVTITPDRSVVSDDIMSRGNRHTMIEIRKAFGEFLTNGAPKIVKDWNGNIWLVAITDNIGGTTDNNIGMGLNSVSGSWTELGDAYDTETLIRNGLINVGR